ncbi:MAG TPA: hypothetical protein VMM84_08955 [Pyrinomonadaceae bacterium]|nr:hypothetical protein [Pyrinomonadaceae bacterium]
MNPNNLLINCSDDEGTMREPRRTRYQVDENLGTSKPDNIDLAVL